MTTASGPEPIADRKVGRWRKRLLKGLLAGFGLLALFWTITFALATYDHTLPLVIDPSLVYSTYLGGDGIDEGTGVAVDPAGNAYVAGWTQSTNFPATAGAYQTTLPTGATQAIRWAPNDSGKLELAVLPTGLGSTATGINNLGWIVGSDFFGSVLQPYILKPNEAERPLPGADRSATVTAINDSGTVIGYVQGAPSVVPMLWTRDGTAVNLGDLVSGSGVANSINRTGQVTGESGSRAFVWDSRAIVRDIGSLGSSATGNGINNRGQVVGSSVTTTGRSHAFIWTPGVVIRDLGVLPGHTQSVATAINDVGWVVGWSK